MTRKLIIGFMVLLTLGLLGGATAWVWRGGHETPAKWRTAVVQKDDVALTISATGTVEPEEVIDVGAQVAGQIMSFGKDEHGKVMDYGSMVRKGDVLAQIDDTVYKAQVTEAQAQLAQTDALLAVAQATLTQRQAKLQQASRDWERAKKLGASEALAQSAFDAYQSAFEMAQADVTVAQASIEQAKAGVATAQASLDRAQRNLDYCTIRSPVDGVIIDRRVNIGQTVVASLSAPSLFLIAEDLKKMEVWVSVNEADIGQIRPGQGVTFTVDAYAGKTFRGQVRKIRLNASMTQNVVTYVVEVETDNADGKLLPYLTANVQFVVEIKKYVWTVPNAVLRWTPTPEQIVPAYREQKVGRHVVWTPEGEGVKPVKVEVGISDGTKTEIGGEAVQEGLTVVIGQDQPAGAKGGGGDASGRSPFTPQMPNRRRN